VDGYCIGKAEQLAQLQLSKKEKQVMMLKTQMFIHNFMTKLTNPIANKEGATAVEYGIMVALIAVAVIVTVGLVGQKLDKVFDKVLTELTSVVP